MHAGAIVGRLSQTVSFPSTFSPECTGQEPNIWSCTHIPRSGDCSVAKLVVTCFTSASCTGASSTGAPPAGTTNSKLPSTTSVAPPPYTTSSADSIDVTNTDSLTLYTGNSRSSESNMVGAVLIGGVVGILCLLALLVVVAVLALIYFIVGKECGQKVYCKNANIHDKSDPVDVNEPALCSELVDVPIEQMGPVYETIMTKSENTAKVSTTDSTCLVDLKENVAYECIAKKITSQTNEAHHASVAGEG